MLTAEQRDEFNRCGIVRMPGAIAKSAVEEMLATIWKNLRERYQIHREAPETWPGTRQRRRRAYLRRLSVHRRASYPQDGNFRAGRQRGRLSRA